MKLFIFPVFALIATAFSVTGCSNSTYALGVVWNHHLYDNRQTNITSVGKQLGVVQKHVNKGLSPDEDESLSNEFPVGTKIFEVPGQDPDKVIACKTPQGSYVQIEVDPNFTNP